MDIPIPYSSHESPPVNGAEIDGGIHQKDSSDNAIVSPSDSLSESEQNLKTEEEEDEAAEEDDEEEDDEEEEEDVEDDRPSIAGEEDSNHPPTKKPKLLLRKEEDPEPHSNGIVAEDDTSPAVDDSGTKNLSVSSKKKPKSKKKTSNSVWISRSSRKGKKKAKPPPQGTQQPEDKVLITPVPRFFDKSDDTPDAKIYLSKVYKAEKVELSDDRLSASSCKGYRMVRATRGVCDGAWYFEIKVVKLGETGHTRLGWSTEKGDLQAPVGYDSNSFGYRDVDGSKVHKALREKYGEEGYKEGDVIGFYINLPEGASFAPKPPQLVWYKGQRYLCALDPKEGPPKIVPGSEISFFKNGVCQGVAFRDLYGGRYFPAASLYTLPNEPNCEVKFNFGPEFDMFPNDFGGRVIPKAMIEVSYEGYDGRSENTNTEEKQS